MNNATFTSKYGNTEAPTVTVLNDTDHAYDLEMLQRSVRGIQQAIRLCIAAMKEDNDHILWNIENTPDLNDSNVLNPVERGQQLASYMDGLNLVQQRIAEVKDNA